MHDRTSLRSVKARYGPSDQASPSMWLRCGDFISETWIVSTKSVYKRYRRGRKRCALSVRLQERSRNSSRPHQHRALADTDQEAKETNEAVQEIVDCCVAADRRCFCCSSAKLLDLRRLL